MKISNFDSNADHQAYLFTCSRKYLNLFNIYTLGRVSEKGPSAYFIFKETYVFYNFFLRTGN